MSGKFFQGILNDWDVFFIDVIDAGTILMANIVTLLVDKGRRTVLNEISLIEVGIDPVLPVCRTARLYDDLGLACYEAMEAFVEYRFDAITE